MLQVQHHAVARAQVLGEQLERLVVVLKCTAVELRWWRDLSGGWQLSEAMANIVHSMHKTD